MSDKNNINSNKYKERSRNKDTQKQSQKDKSLNTNKSSKGEKNNNKTKAKTNEQSDEQRLKQKLVNNLNKYQPVYQHSNKNEKKATQKEILDSKKQKGNTILLEAGSSQFLYDLRNILVYFLPDDQKNDNKVYRESHKSYFFNITNLDAKRMEEIESIIRNHEYYTDKIVTMKLLFEDIKKGGDIKENKETKDKEVNIKDCKDCKDDIDNKVLVDQSDNNEIKLGEINKDQENISNQENVTNNKSNNNDLVIKEENGITTEVQITEELDVNSQWEEKNDDQTNEKYYYNKYLELSLSELPLGASLLKTDLKSQELSQLPETNISNTNIITDYQNEAELQHRDFFETNTKEKIIWNQLQNKKLTELMKRPARKQIDSRQLENTAYTEGHYDYNIWYDKYLTDRKEDKALIASLYKCVPELDIGFTRADYTKQGDKFFCLFFARGCCSEGVNCHYFHRVPTLEDCSLIDNMKDVFGRSRHSTHRTDMGGVGTFTRECDTLYISNVKSIGSSKDMIRLLYKAFSPWGKIEDINYIEIKASCFIRYAHRCMAEFGKEAMIGQSIVGTEVVFIRWAVEEQDKIRKDRKEIEDRNKFLNAYKVNTEKIRRSGKGNLGSSNNGMSDKGNIGLSTWNNNSGKFSLSNQINKFNKGK